MLRLLHLLLVVITLAAYLPPLVHPSTFWPISTLGLLTPILWFCLLLFALFLLYRRDKTVLLSIVTLLLGWDMISSAFAVSGQAPPVPAHGFSIATLNGHGFWRGPQEEQAAFVKALDADIILFQEFIVRQQKAKELLDLIQNQSGYAHRYYEAGGPLVILSRYPLKDPEVSYFSNRANGLVYVDVETPGGTMRLFNVHLQTNAISHLANEVTSNGNLRESGTWQKVKTMFGRYGRSNKIRTEQAAEILTTIAQSPYPVVLGGDLNDVPTSYLYQQFRTVLQDAHLAASWGLGTTYQGLLPGLRIDYILPAYGFTIHDFSRVDCAFSDHRAVRAVVSMTEKKE